MTEAWRPAPLQIVVDHEHGGRWTSLRARGREWLWANPDAAVRGRRATVRPGAAFVDAGGIEECFPSVRGDPDHGDVWSRPWSGTVDAAEVRLPGGTRLGRRIATSADAVRVEYEVTGDPGTSFVHAVHALLDVSPSARLVIPEARTMVVIDDDDGTVRPWPSGLDLLGPDDGSATCVLVPRCHQATVVDGEHALDLAWSCPARPDLCSLLLWRNLGGWPDDGPYRSIGVEPMVGRTADLAVGGRAASCSIGPAGRARWSLEVSARTLSESLQV